MQEYGGVSSKGEYRDGGPESRERSVPHQDGFQQHQYAVNVVMQQKSYGCTSKDLSDQNLATYCRVATGIYEATASSQQYQNPRHNNSTAPTFSSPPNSPLVGLVFDPSSPNYCGSGMIGDRGVNTDRRSQSSWSISNQEPIGTGAKKKIVKSQDKRNTYSADPRYHERYKDINAGTDRPRKDRNLTSDSTSSLDFFAEGEKMVSELCNIPDSRTDSDNQKQNHKPSNQDAEKSRASVSSEVLLTALDKIVIHDQIPNQIVQLAVEACTDAENIAIAHHNRPCFKNIHSICAKTRSNVQKPDSAVANLHSQGIPWVIKNFIFSFVRILDGWKGVKELLSEKHDTFSRIENKYYSPNIRECFVQWQAVTKEMLTHIYKTYKCLDHGFTMEQKSFTHNYYTTNSTASRNQNKFQPSKSRASTPLPVNSSPQPFNAVQPPWMQNQSQVASQSYNEGPWPGRSGVAYKKYPVVPPPNSHSFYPLNDQSDITESYQKTPYRCDPCSVREAKPRQSWTITNVSDFRALESMCHADQRELYTQLKHKMDAELGKAPGQALLGNMSCDLLQRRDMELKAKMIPLSHVEKTLIPSMAAVAEARGCYVQKNNSCGDTKEEADFFAAWGQMVQKEPNDYITHHTHNIQLPSNVVTISNNISGPVKFIDPENDEFHEMTKVYMKPGSYKVPIKPADPISPFVQGTSQDVLYENAIDDITLKGKAPFPSVTLAPQPKYNLESWPCLMSRRTDDLFIEDQKLMSHLCIPGIDIRAVDSLDFLSSMTSDRAWEAAKQSAPKLMDFIHEGSKSDTARLYDALGLSATDEFSEEFNQTTLGMNHNDAWSTGITNHLMPKDLTRMWNQSPLTKNDYLMNETQDQSLYTEDTSRLYPPENKPLDPDDSLEIQELKNVEQKKEKPRCPNFDQSGNIREDTQKKFGGKSKVAISGMWYHPKKKKLLPTSTIKKFEIILNNLSQMNEAAFIQHDMDIKVAPRFYEVVKYPMCLHDISTKLKNSSYYEYDQVVQDFRRIFNNVRLYLKSYPDACMKKNVNKVSNEFEKILNEEFQNKYDSKVKSQEVNHAHDTNKKECKVADKNAVTNNEDTKQSDTKTSGDENN